MNKYLNLIYHHKFYIKENDLMQSVWQIVIALKLRSLLNMMFDPFTAINTTYQIPSNLLKMIVNIIVFRVKSDLASYGNRDKANSVFLNFCKE